MGQLVKSKKNPVNAIDSIESEPYGEVIAMTAFDLALLVVRVMLGITFVLHGSQKLFGWFGGGGIKGTSDMMRNLGTAAEHHSLLAWMAALSEFGGGLLVLFGFLTPLGAAVIIGVMLTAIANVHVKKGFFSTAGGYEFNLNVIAEAIALILAGAGAVSIDHLLGIAVPVNQLPIWIVVILVLIPF